MPSRGLPSIMALCLLTTCISIASDDGQTGTELKDWTGHELANLLPLYEQFHMHPELSLAERETAARLADELRKTGADVTTDIGGHGVVALLRNGDGPTVLVRTDLDALPVTENTGVPYSSKSSGVMHACGHDAHMTCLIGTARFLASHKNQWHGTVMLIGQPAEERVMGAAAMLKDGLYERFAKPDYALALHVDSALAAGHVAVLAGYCMANTDGVEILVKGKGGHGAYPHTTVDPIVQAAQLILALQTIVSREVSPIEPAVITVGAIQGGTKNNVIPDICRLQLTVRSYSSQVREQLLEAIQRKAKGIAASCGAPEPEVKVTVGSPAVRNDEQLAVRAEQVFRAALGDAQVGPAEKSLAGEDFGLFSQGNVPILLFRLGSVSETQLAAWRRQGKTPPSLHSPEYCIEAGRTIETGIVAMSSLIVDLLK